jgi:hypothetical protein
VTGVPVDLASARRFVLESARLLDRHRLAVLLDGASIDPVLVALRAYRNDDGGFGHALEPDVRDPASQPASTLHALEVLAEVQAPDDPMVASATSWLAGVANDDGSVPFVLPSAADHPRAPWMEPDPSGSFLTLGVLSRLTEAPAPTGAAAEWAARAERWCWSRAEGDAEGYWLKFVLDFLDHVPDDIRARRAVERFGSRIRPDGTVPVAGGTAEEHLTPLDLSPRPGRRSRLLFTDEQVDADLDRLEQAQQADGGWTFDWLAWSPGQEVEWRGAVTLRALATLAAHGRLAFHGPS